jgi:hypothetical protein
MSASFSSFSSEFVATSPLSLSSFHQFSMEPPMPSRSSLNVSSLFQGVPRGSPRRRGQYYFDDGNVIFLVRLFQGFIDRAMFIYFTIRSRIHFTTSTVISSNAIRRVSLLYSRWD